MTPATSAVSYEKKKEQFHQVGCRLGDNYFFWELQQIRKITYYIHNFIYNNKLYIHTYLQDLLRLH